MELEEIQPWWFIIEPLEGESISHYFRKFYLYSRVLLNWIDYVRF